MDGGGIRGGGLLARPLPDGMKIACGLAGLGRAVRPGMSSKRNGSVFDGADGPLSDFGFVGEGVLLTTRRGAVGREGTVSPTAKSARARFPRDHRDVQERLHSSTSCSVMVSLEIPCELSALHVSILFSVTACISAMVRSSTTLLALRREPAAASRGGGLVSLAMLLLFFLAVLRRSLRSTSLSRMSDLYGEAPVGADGSSSMMDRSDGEADARPARCLSSLERPPPSLEPDIIEYLPVSMVDDRLTPTLRLEEVVLKRSL